MAVVEVEPQQLQNVHECSGCHYRSIAIALPIIMRVQCLRTDVVQAVQAVPFDYIAQYRHFVLVLQAEYKAM
tara:strand:- start:838 stop:1053 length:216 start_codon:yes stop_codon:yes gene_type:complete